MVIEFPRLSNSPTPNCFNQTSPSKVPRPDTPGGAANAHRLASARTHTRAHCKCACSAFPHPRFAPPSPSKDPDTHGPEQPTSFPRPSSLPCCRQLVPSGGTRHPATAPPPRVPRREMGPPRARFLETRSSRNLSWCLGLTDPGVPRASAEPASPNGLSRSPSSRPPVPLGPEPPPRCCRRPAWCPYLAWGGSELPKIWWWRARAGRAAPSATWPPAWFHRGDPNRGGQPEAPAAQPASPALLCLSSLLPAALRAASAASRAAAPAPGRPVSPHRQPPLPEPLLHLTAAPQPPARSRQPRSASCTRTALGSPLLRSSSARGSDPT